MNHPVLSTFAGFVGFILVIISTIIATFASKRYWWLSIICAFLAGFLPGICAYNLRSGILLGIFFVLFVVPGSILTGYYRKKAINRIKSIDK